MIAVLGPQRSVRLYYRNGPASLRATLSLCDSGLLSLSEAEQRVAEILSVDCRWCNIWPGVLHELYVQMTKDCDHSMLLWEAVMVCPPILHIAPNPRSRLRWLNPFLTLSDRPPTPLGRRPTSHSLSWTLVCFCHPSLLDILDSP